MSFVLLGKSSQIFLKSGKIEGTGKKIGND